MRPSDINIADALNQKFVEFAKVQPLYGIENIDSRNCLIEQVIDSIRRIKYVQLLANKKFDEFYTDPNHKYFDPLKAAAFQKQHNNFDEACWLTFLSIHFGRNIKTKWNLLKAVYSGLNDNEVWSWDVITSDIKGFRHWLADNNEYLKSFGNFGNHRKYESLDGLGARGTGAAIESYINLITTYGNHSEMFAQYIAESADPKMAFQKLYEIFGNVLRFGRTAKFDYLTMIGKLGLAEIEPPSTYMSGATGPFVGATLLFCDIGTKKTINELDEILIKFENHLGLNFGMQVLEDALCNWQKSPKKYIYFGG